MSNNCSSRKGSPPPVSILLLSLWGVTVALAFSPQQPRARNHFVYHQPTELSASSTSRGSAFQNNTGKSIQSSARNLEDSSRSTKPASDVPPFLLNSFLSSSPEDYRPPSTTTSTTTAPLECDDVNRPPSLNILLRTLHQLTRQGSSTDIRGRFTDHKRVGTMSSVAHEIGRMASGPYAPLTPFAAYCLGHGLARFIIDRQLQQQQMQQQTRTIRIALGQDPRTHGMRLADSFARGAEAASTAVSCVQVYYTGIATTPACAAFGRLVGTDAGVMVTASHLPADRNGFKFFWQDGACLSKAEIAALGNYASSCAVDCFNTGMVPPASGRDAVMCHKWVDFMSAYEASLKQAIQQEVLGGIDNFEGDEEKATQKCLKGLTLVVNAGHGSGGFFNQLLKDMGADVSGSIGCEPDEEFPLGIPNPEYKPMIDATIATCQKVQADLGIMLDTDSDRCGFVVPTSRKNEGGFIHYEPLNRNRLIALFGVILSETNPGAAVVTDSVTSEGLSSFLEEKMGLRHVRYIKGYQNVIGKAKELTERGIMKAELAMETSGHGAMKENYYIDDGAYTALKVVGLLAKRTAKDPDNRSQLLDLIADMDELDVIAELRFKVMDDSLQTMHQLFDFCALEIERLCAKEDHGAAVDNWSIDNDNLEGIRIRVGKGQFFMIRKSLHDPVISLQLEAASREEAKKLIVDPLLTLFESEEQIKSRLNLEALQGF